MQPSRSSPRRSRGSCSEPTRANRPASTSLWLRRQRQLDDLVVAAGDPEPDLPADELADEEALEVADALDRAAVQLDDQVAGSDARRRRGAPVEELDHLERRGRDRGRGRARRGSGRVPPTTPRYARRTRPSRISEARIARVVASIGTASPRPIPGDRGVDADDAPARIGKRAAGVARVQRGVGLDHVLDEPARLGRRGSPAIDRAR